MRFGHPRPMNQRTMSNMWIPMSPMVPLPYSMNCRQLRWISGLYGSIGAGPTQNSQSSVSGTGAGTAAVARPPP